MSETSIISQALKHLPKDFKPSFVVTDMNAMITPLGSKEACVKALEANIKHDMAQVKAPKLSGSPSTDTFGK